MKSCITCGMPLEGAHSQDVALETDDGAVCKYDVKDGQIKPAEEIFAGGVAYFTASATGGDKELAERVTRKNMKGLPYWQKHPAAVLEGPEATDAEFAAAMSKM